MAGRLHWERGRWKVGIGQRYVQDQSSQTTLEVKLKWNEDWAFRVYDRYEFEEGASKEFEFTASRAFQCVITDFTYNRREGDTLYRGKAFRAGEAVDPVWTFTHNSGGCSVTGGVVYRGSALPALRGNAVATV